MERQPSHIIIGMGEVGQALVQVIGPAATKDLDNKDIKFGDDHPTYPVMHVAFPYSDKFIDEVMKYKKRYRSELVVIYSTIPIGTTKKLGEGFVHSPVEGKHPYLKRSIIMATRWIGSTDEHALKRAATMWANVVEKVHMVNDSDYTEFLKLRSTSRFGINLAFARYEKSVADKLNMDWNELMEFDRDYNDLYAKLNMPNMQRYILTPPGDKIGGHCIVPNAELLNKDYPDDMLEKIT